MQITEFLTARYAEATEDARYVHRWDCAAFENGANLGDCGCGVPQAILAGIAANRAILGFHSTPHTVVEPFDGGQWCVDCGGWPCTHEGEAVCLLCGCDDGCPTTRALTMPHAARPDANPLWRFDG